MNIAIYGGSFDPVHLGHIEVVKKALKELEVDKIIVMPNYLNPLKNNNFANSELRLKWLKTAFKDFKKVEISDYEIKQKKPVYTINTIKYFKPKFFIIGADNLKTLDKWYKIDEILKLTELIVAKRGEVDKKLLKRYNIQKVLDTNINISSTDIRNCNFKYLVKEVEDEIKEFYEKSCKNKRST